MFGRSALIGAVVALCGISAWAVPVHLSFAGPSGQSLPAATRVRIYAARMVGDSATAVPIESDAGPDGAVLNLGEGVWEVQALAAGYWSQGAEITVSGAAANAQIAFWPASYLQGEVTVGQGGTAPQALHIRLSATAASSGSAAAAPPSGQPGQTPASAELNCPVSGGKWSCVGPAGVFDARLAADGYAPVYDWAVNLKPGASTNLGQTQLQTALSVFGRAVSPDGSNPPGPCLATLVPYAVRSFGPGPQVENPPPDEKTYTVPVNEQGYFQVVGVMPGHHLLFVECLAASGLTPVQVAPDGETRLDSPLVLQDVTLKISVSPTTDPAGKPWQLTVVATAPRIRGIADGAPVSANGAWIKNGLMAGSYRVFVRDSDGMEWLRQDFELSANSKPLALKLASVKVAGKVTLSGEPVKATLSFSNQAGGDPITLKSDDNGNFAGRLPITAGAEESVWDVEADVDHPETVRHLKGVDVPTMPDGQSASLDLELPSIPLQGSVVTPDGQPQASAQVTVKNLGTGYQTATRTGGDGSFEIEDLPPGNYDAVARSSYGVSDPKEFSVADSSQNKVKLILNPYVHASFYVLSSGKDPISDAAVQVWVAPGVPHAFVKTDQNGRFQVSLAPGTNEVGLTVGASDYDISLTKMSVATPPPDSNGDNQPSQPDGPTDQNTITLDTNGGTLMLNFEPADGTLDRSAMLYLVHNGSIADARTLAGWGTDQAGSDSQGPEEVDGIEPGEYSLCVVMNPSQMALLWQGQAPKQTCATGSVKAGQTLTLTPPDSAAQSPDAAAAQ